MMFTAMTGLVAIQIIWIRRAVIQREEQFNHGVDEALGHISDLYEQHLWANSLESMLDWSSLEENMQGYLDSLSRLAYCAEDDFSGYNDFGGEAEFKLNLRLPMNNALGIGFAQPGSLSGGLTLPYLFSTEQEQTGQYLESLDQTYRILTESRNIIGNMLRELVSGYSLPASEEIDSAFVVSLIPKELQRSGIKTPYKYAVIDGFTGKYLFGNLKNIPDIKNSSYRTKIGLNSWTQNNELVLFFPYKTRFLLKNIMFLLLASAVLILLIITSFAYTITVIFKQKKISEIKNDLINNITHELKTPISTISLASQALQDPDLRKVESLQQKYLLIIRDENHRLGQLVENVLQSAVFDRGESRLKVKRVDLHQKIDKVLSSLDMQAQSKQIKINKNLHAGQPVAEVDDVMITNLIFNLMDNAMKYSASKDPFVTISTWNEGDSIYIEVADNGIGISKDDQKRIFEKLYRVPTGNVHNVKGYGLGLSYVKSIVESHKGTIEVDSALGEGSRFTIRLPLNQPQ
jgi:two-component system, OmpR family, phosphate regulon sensor histidine kinase PhoR